VLALVLGIGVPLQFYSMELTTEVDPDYLRIRFFPFIREEIQLSEISSWEVRA
jgi:hypothetical protein